MARKPTKDEAQRSRLQEIAKANKQSGMVWVQMLRNSVDPHGNPLHKHVNYLLGSSLATVLTKKGRARPGIVALAEQLGMFGVVGITINADTDEGLVAEIKRQTEDLDITVKKAKKAK